MENNRKELKIMFLKEVLKRKDDLFGAFSAFRTKETKVEAWKDVHTVAKALQLVPASKNFVYTRDVLWQNIKKASVKKRDNSRQTGTAGGPSAKINATDELVYEIIGKESAVLDGLAISESTVENQPNSPELPHDGSSSPVPSVDRPRPAPANIPKKPVMKPMKKQANPDLKKLKEKKLQLMISYLELKIEKTKREIGALPPTPPLQAALPASDSPIESQEFADIEFLDDSD